MEETLRELYIRETSRDGLDFDSDPEYQAYYTQTEALWEGGEMPPIFFHLLDTSNSLAFAHGLRTGLNLCGDKLSRL